MQPSTVTKAYKRFVRIDTLGVAVVSGPDQGRDVAVDGDTLTVGTAQDNHLVLTDPTVSRYHLELSQQPTGTRITDLGSTNGTYVAGVRLERGIAHAGAVIDLGGSQLRIHGGAHTVVQLHPSDELCSLRGRTPVMRRLMALVDRIASSDVQVLITGESGTGKELVARAIHERSTRAGGPFVTVDCGAISAALVSSELFGHERGAFTGAEAMRPGAFERAHRGTLFLDEIGELPAELQSYLLGTLERRRFVRLGGRTEIGVDIRVVSATNRDVRAAVNEGKFRLDLDYRVAAATIEVPPLRARLDDLPLLVEHFVRQAGTTDDVEKFVSESDMERLMSHSWPGNVRELRNAVETAVAIGEPVDFASRTENTTVSLSEDAIGQLGHMRYGEARAALLRQFERGYLSAILQRAGGNVSRAAREAGMNRSHLIDLLRRAELK